MSEVHGVQVPPFLVPYDEHVNPAQVATWLRWVVNETWATDGAIRRARDEWVQAKTVLDANRRAIVLAEDTPVAGTKLPDGGRVTVAYVEAWVDDKVASEILMEAIAAAKVDAAKGRYSALGKIANDLQTLNANMRGDTNTGGRWGR